MCVAIVGLSRCRPAAECHGSAQWHAATLCICAYGTSSHVPGCGSERRRRRHYLHPALTHTQPQVVASSKPLPFENTTNFTELECCWCGVLEAPIPSPVGLDAIFFFFILTFWHLHGKFWNVFQRETDERGERSNSV